MGDFYELFFDDAVTAAAALDITLTQRGQHLGQDVPMCGVPVHAAEAILSGSYDKDTELRFASRWKTRRGQKWWCKSRCST